MSDQMSLQRGRFQELLRHDRLVVMPGGCTPLFARMAQEAGFECFFLAGSQTSAFVYGVPDVGVMGLRDMADHARSVAAHCDIPVLVDGDTGYGGAVNVRYAVQEFVRSGAAALQIEDQEAPKKSGTSAGRRLISLDEAVGKYRAAVDARDELDPSFAICARTDAIGAEPGGAGESPDRTGGAGEPPVRTEGFEEAVERAAAYVREGGVDFVWLNSVQSREELGEACARIPGPVLATWGGPRPAPTLEELERLGVRIALYPVVASRPGAQAVWEMLHDFRERGTAAIEDWNARATESRWGAVDLGRLVGADGVRALEERYLPQDQRRDYDTTFGHRPGGA
jgi:2-methylisocitrate lyase-like PEP mutase family enzyme